MKLHADIRLQLSDASNVEPLQSFCFMQMKKDKYC